MIEFFVQGTKLDVSEESLDRMKPMFADYLRMRIAISDNMPYKGRKNTCWKCEEFVSESMNVENDRPAKHPLCDNCTRRGLGNCQCCMVAIDVSEVFDSMYYVSRPIDPEIELRKMMYDLVLEDYGEEGGGNVPPKMTLENSNILVGLYLGTKIDELIDALRGD